jgi:hypothetical protein
VLLNVMLDRPGQARVVIGEARRVFPRNPFLGSMESVIAQKTGDIARAISLMEQTAAWPEMPRAGWLALARLYHRAGRRGDAERVLRTVLEKSPDYCEGRAALAGLAVDAGRIREARQLVATRAAAGSPRCEATAAAALGDAAGVAAVFRRIAEDETLLRNWLLFQFGLNGEFAWSQRLYPWAKVAEAPEVVAAYDEVRTAMARLTPVIEDALKSLPPESR